MKCPICRKEKEEVKSVFHFCKECIENSQWDSTDRVEILLDALKDLTEGDCSYGDNCPTFGSRHYRCYSCKARKALKEYYEENK